MWRLCTGSTCPYRSTFHSLVCCHPEDWRILVYSGHSFLLPRFPAGQRKMDRKMEGCKDENESKVYGLPSEWYYEQEACYCSVNVLKIMMMGRQRLAQTTCHYLCVERCMCVCGCVYLAQTGCYARVSVGAPFHAAVTALTGWEAHITHSTPADKWV